MNSQLTITMPDDWHVHLREDETLADVVDYSAKHFGRALVMPNTVPAILTGSDAVRYREQILAHTREKYPHFEPVMSIKLTMNTTAQMIYDAYQLGVRAVKLYPTGATTNSEDGVDLTKLDLLIERRVFEMMTNCNMVLCIHAEIPESEVLEREVDTLRYLYQLLESTPSLKITVEHVSTANVAEFVYRYGSGRIAASITAHHLYLTLTDLLGAELQPHWFCKPVVKQEADREALWHYLKHSPDFFFGSDSAPHPVIRKEACSCAAGAFTSPIALPLLAEMFERQGCLSLLEDFVSLRGAAFYGFAPNPDTITLRKLAEPISSHLEVGSHKVMPLRSGDSLSWEVVER